MDSGLTNISAAAFSDMGSNLLFTGIGDYSTGGGVFLSTDTAKSWTAVNSGLTNINVWALEVVGTNLFAGTWGGGVFRSLDTGKSWTSVNSGLTNLTINAFFISGKSLFAGTAGGGVFLSTDSSNNWISINDSLSNLYVSTLWVNNGYLFVAIQNGCIWRRSLTEIVAVKYAQNNIKPQKMVNLRVERGTMLRYTLSVAASISFRVYNLRGRLIHSSMPERKAAGSYSLPLSAGSLAQGNYIIDFNAGDFRTQKTIAVIR
jgi:hypothetical protein